MLFEYDLDYIIKKIHEQHNLSDDFIEDNQLRIADPVEWDVNTTYDVLTIVIGPDGYDYLSIQTAPEGVDISNSWYWMKVHFDE